MRSVALLVVTAMCACSGSGEPDGGVVEDSGAPTQFIAQTRDFQGFMDWESLDVTPTNDGHPADAGRTVYRKQLPGPDAYATGSILVKASMTGATIQEWTLHAMAKRGPGFNEKDGGTKGWEWFELAFDPDERVVIVSRGTDGDHYPGSTPLTCNGCHSTSAHDGIMSPALYPR